jgi:hypothetical protein
MEFKIFDSGLSFERKLSDIASMMFDDPDNDVPEDQDNNRLDDSSESHIDISPESDQFVEKL